MRLQLSKEAITLLHALRAESAPLHAALAEIMHNPDQQAALRSTERPSRRELFVRVGTRGFWIGYEVETDRGETVIRAGIVEN